MTTHLSNSKQRLQTRKLLPIVAAALFISAPLASQTCDREAIPQYQKASNEMKTLDSSVHAFLNSLDSKKGIERLILAYKSPQYITEFHRRLTALAKNQPKLTQNLSNFYLCSGLTEAEIESRFGEIFELHNKQLKHLQGHDEDFSQEQFTTMVNANREQAVTYFGDEDNGLLTPLTLTKNIFKHIAKNYAQQATIFDLWELKQAKGSQGFMAKTGINILKNSPEAQLQKHLDRGLSEDSFLSFTGPKEGEEYPHSIHYFASEIAHYNGSDNLPSVDEIPNRSKLAITIAMSDKHEKEFIKLLTQFETAANQFKTRAEKRYKIKDWQNTPKQVTTENQVFQTWAILNYQSMRQQAEAIDQLLDPKADKNWQAIVESIEK